MRALVPLLAACLALLVPASASALAPPPTVRTFDDVAEGTSIEQAYDGTDVDFAAAGNFGSCPASGAVFASTAAPSQPNYLAASCAESIIVSFTEGQAYVAMWVEPASPIGLARRSPQDVTLRVLDGLGTEITSRTFTVDDSFFTPISLSAPAATIRSAVLEFGSSGAAIDDVAYSPVLQPDTEITARPPADTKSTSASFAWETNSDNRGSTCTIDGDEIECASPTTFSELTEGTHRFTAAAFNEYNDVDPTPATVTWRVDLTAPATTIDSGPPDLSRSASATFTFSSPDGDVDHFDCALDTAAAEECASPKTYTGLAEGDHEFRVRAVDRAGNSRAVRRDEWTIDLTRPTTTLGSPTPPDPSNSKTATFRFASPSPDLAGFQCSLDGAAFATCTSPTTYTDLPEGRRTFRVRAIDDAGNVDGTPVQFQWVVNTGEPRTVIDEGPPALTNQTAATLHFSSASTDVARFQCALDEAAFAPCVSPATFTVGEGSHSARVRAIDVAGNRDSSPAQHDWRVDLTPPDTAIGDLSLGASPSLTFSSPDADTDHFECALDAAPFTGCASPFGLAATALALGGHNVAVRAVDAAANADATPATRDWTISRPDLDGDGVPDAQPDNCLERANADQADRDGDGIGDACEVLPSGDLPAQAGERAAARVVSGEVFVKLPGASTKAAQKGFVPLEGLATLPMGSLVDTRAGVAAITTAADFLRAANRRHRTQNARLAAGIFRIKQARKRRKAAPKRPFTDLALVSAAGSEAVCATRSRTSPTKGLVRQVTVTTSKGRFRTFGGASTTTAVKGAAFTTIDRCTGTETKVTRGKVRVLDRSRGRTLTVTARKTYIAKARLFRTKKGRRT